MFREPNRALWWVVGGATVGMSLILMVPFLRNLFHFNRIHLSDLMLCMGAAVVSILWFEALKLTAFRTHARNGKG